MTGGGITGDGGSGGEPTLPDPRLRVSLNGNVAYETYSSQENVYNATNDVASIFLPAAGPRLAVSVTFQGYSSFATGRYDCASGIVVPFAFTVETDSTVLDELPAEWQGQIFGARHCDGSEPDVATASVNVTEATSSNLHGTFSITIVGGGPRSGSTLVAEGSFDGAP